MTGTGFPNGSDSYDAKGGGQGGEEGNITTRQLHSSGLGAYVFQGQDDQTWILFLKISDALFFCGYTITYVPVIILQCPSVALAI